MKTPIAQQTFHRFTVRSWGRPIADAIDEGSAAAAATVFVDKFDPLFLHPSGRLARSLLMESCQLGRETLSGDGYPLADETRPRAGDAGDYASYFQRRQGRRGQTQDFLHIWRKPQDSMKPRAGQSEWSFLKGRAIERLCGCRRHFRHFVEVTEGGAAEVSEVVKDAPHDSGVEAGYPYFSFRVND